MSAFALCKVRCIGEFTPLCFISTISIFSKHSAFSVFQLAELCVSVSILIQSISMGSTSYFVFASHPVCVCYLNTCVFLAHLLETVCLLCMYNPLESVCACMRVCACAHVYNRVCVRGIVFPGLLVIMFLGVMGGT